MKTLNRTFVRILLLVIFVLAHREESKAQTIASLVSVTPCRIIDTRNPAGAFGGPSLVPNGTREINIPSSSCSIPSGAVAYVLNVTVVPHGIFDYLTMWPTGQTRPLASTINGYSGAVAANGAIVPAGTNGSINVFATGAPDLILDISGYFVSQTLPTPQTLPAMVTQSSSNTTQNTALGTGTTSSNGALNTAIGASALSANYDASFNTAVGAGALASHSSGNDNTAVGANALSNSSNGYGNSVLGSHGMQNNGIGANNTAVGYYALSANVTGLNNTAVGANALQQNTGGKGNIAIGMNAGMNLTTGSNNIDIGNDGVAGESGVIRIGASVTAPPENSQNSIYIPAVYSNNITGTAVVVDATGKLGRNASSRRYKEDIRDIGESSSNIFKLRPVQFRYKQAAADGSKPLQYGLIAEEVESVFPQMVVRDREGRADGVQYQQLPPMLLNEMQKQQKTIERQAEEIRELLRRVEALESASSAATPAGTPAGR